MLVLSCAVQAGKHISVFWTRSNCLWAPANTFFCSTSIKLFYCKLEVHGCNNRPPPLALPTQELYFPNMEHLKIVVIFTVHFHIFQKCENNKLSVFHKIYNLPTFFGYGIKYAA